MTLQFVVLYLSLDKKEHLNLSEAHTDHLLIFSKSVANILFMILSLLERELNFFLGHRTYCRAAVPS